MFDNDGNMLLLMGHISKQMIFGMIFERYKSLSDFEIEWAYCHMTKSDSLFLSWCGSRNELNIRLNSLLNLHDGAVISSILITCVSSLNEYE